MRTKCYLPPLVSPVPRDVPLLDDDCPWPTEVRSPACDVAVALVVAWPLSAEALAVVPPPASAEADCLPTPALLCSDVLTSPVAELLDEDSDLVDVWPLLSTSTLSETCTFADASPAARPAAAEA